MAPGKIVFCYEYDGDGPQWSTPNSLLREFESRGVECKRLHLSKATESDYRNVIEWNPSAFITMDWKGLDIPGDIKRTLYHKGTFLIKELGDTPQSFNRHYHNLSEFDLLLSPDYQSTERLKTEGYNAIWQPHWADTRIQPTQPLIFSQPYVRSTRGPGGSQFLDTLSVVMRDKFSNKNGLSGQEHAEFLAGGLITVQASRHKEYTRRIPEALLAGTMILTDRLPDSTHIGDMFTEGHDIVYYDSLSTCVSLINFYLSPEGSSERIKIAKNGYDNVVRNHTQIQRVDQILEEYNIWKTE